ncbi:MAG TPA: hypothetical protein VK327_06435 [Candidatus Paceibacterota bacterium]|nr:hypothetical protein [Candidatus Paceibacterota bacterium]
MTTWVCLNGNPWWVGTPINFSQYSALEFDIRWDNTSDISIAQFNDLSTIPLTQTNSAGQVVLNAQLNGGSIGGIDINVCGGAGGQIGTLITNMPIPALAASGWVHVVIPIDSTKGNLDGASGIVFHKWVNIDGGKIANNFQGRFWVDNVLLKGTSAPPPPPTVAKPLKAVPGLNVFASTEGNGFWDRQQIMSRQSTGLCWIGNASAGNPVSYSFTISSFPTDPATYGCEAYLFLSPNIGWNPSAPDWNDTNCTIVKITMNTNGAVMRFEYKVDEANEQAMYAGGTDNGRGISYTNAPGSWDGVSANHYESGHLGTITNATPIGTWTVRFTSDTNVTLIAPNSTSTSFTIPPYNVAKLGETAAGFNVYLGFQANNAPSINQAVVYSSFSISGVPAPIDENFLTQTVLDTTTLWDTSGSGGPKGVVVVPADAKYWIQWSLPASGFSLESGASLTDPLGWVGLTNGPAFSQYGLFQQLVSNSELMGSQQFFRLVKRTFTKLQVLLPGESPAPNTLTGKTGTPTAAVAGDFVQITVRAVDSNWNLVSSSDIVNITSSDASDVMSLDAGLVGGVGTFTIQVGNAGTRTITATDMSDNTKTPNTSSTLTVN